MTNRAYQHFGDYYLTRFLGRGSFGDVYLGEHVYDKSFAAVKVLEGQHSANDLREFINEVGMLFRLKHPHIVQLFAFGVREDGIPYLVMAYASNGTLESHHPKGVPLALDRIILYVEQIASALQYAHDNRVIHRDIKPANILLGANNELLLSDFGIGITAHSTNSWVEQKEAGTPDYMAPEQFVGKAVPASDQYSLAVAAYEWFCGERPFHGNFAQLAVQHHLNILPPPLHEKMNISPAVEQVVMKALEKNPKNRFSTIQAFALALEDVLVSHIPEPIPAKPVTPMPPAQKNLLDGFMHPGVPGLLNTAPLSPHPSQPQPSPGRMQARPAQPVDELYEESLRAQTRGQIKTAFQGYQQIVFSRNASANQIAYAKNKLQELREPYIALFIREARTHAQAGRWRDIEAIMTELQQLQPPPSTQELKAIRRPYIAQFIGEARKYAQAGHWRDTEATLTKLQQLQPPPSTQELKAIRKLYIAKRVEEAGKYCLSGDWDAEKNVWQELLQFNPTKEELQSQPIFVASTDCFTSEREAKDTRIQARISIAEQNKQHGRLYERARQAFARGEKAIARDHLQNLWSVASSYGDPAQIARQTGIAGSRNCEESSKRIEAIFYTNALLSLISSIIIVILTSIINKGNASEIYFQITIVALPLISATISATTAYYKTAGAAGTKIPVAATLAGILAFLPLIFAGLIGFILAILVLMTVMAGSVTGIWNFPGLIPIAVPFGALLALTLILLLLGWITANSLGIGLEIIAGIAGICLLFYLGAPIPVLTMDVITFIISLFTAAFAVGVSRRYWFGLSWKMALLAPPWID